MLLVGLILLVVLAIITGFVVKFKLETSKMTPVATGKLTDKVFAIQNDFVNMYLVKDGSNYVAIDTGKDLKVVEAAMKSLGIETSKVHSILLTHTDMDHVAGIPIFPQAKLYLAEEEVDMLNGKKQKIPFINNKVARSDYILLKDGAELKIGALKVKCILAKGHTTGSMCFLIDDHILFTGDILSFKEGKLGSSVRFFDLDHAQARETIAKIAALPRVEYVFTSHFGFTANFETAAKAWKG